MLDSTRMPVELNWYTVGFKCGSLVSSKDVKIDCICVGLLCVEGCWTYWIFLWDTLFVVVVEAIPTLKLTEVNHNCFGPY